MLPSSAKAEMPWLFLGLRVLPVSGVALLGSLVANLVPGDELSSMTLLLTIVLALVLFVALLTFRRTQGWNLTLLLGFSLCVGFVLEHWFPQGRQGSWGTAMLLVLAIVAAAALVAQKTHPWLARVAGILWLLSWFYLIGWLISMILRPPAISLVIWSLVGLAVFGGLASGWFSSRMRLGDDQGESAVSLATDFYLIGLNLLIAARVLTASLASL